MTPTLILAIAGGVLIAAGVYLLLERSLTRVLVGLVMLSGTAPSQLPGTVVFFPSSQRVTRTSLPPTAHPPARLRPFASVTFRATMLVVRDSLVPTTALLSTSLLRVPTLSRPTSALTLRLLV